MDVVSEFTSKVPLMILQGFLKGFMMVWWVFLIPIGYVGVRLFLSLKFDVRTFWDFISFVKNIKNKNEVREKEYELDEDVDEEIIESTVKSNNFPDNFVWMNNYTYFKFGSHGIVRFDVSNSKIKNVFRMLTDAKGDFVETQAMAEQISDSPENTRVILNNLRKKIKNIPKIREHVDIETNHKGYYKLAINPVLLEQ